MAKKVDFKLNLQGLNQIMRSEDMQNILDEYGQEICARANAGKVIDEAEYKCNTYPIRWIAVSNIGPANAEAGIDNLKNNTLLKAKAIW